MVRNSTKLEEKKITIFFKLILFAKEEIINQFNFQWRRLNQLCAIEVWINIFLYIFEQLCKSMSVAIGHSLLFAPFQRKSLQNH